MAMQSARTIDPRAMPLTGLANAAIDRVAPERQALRRALRATPRRTLPVIAPNGPAKLVERQETELGPAARLGAAALRRGLRDHDGTDACRRSRQATVERLAHAVAALDSFQLAGLSPLVTVGGSLVAALAVLEKAVTPEQAWDAVSIDERWQLEQWGADAEAEAAMENRRREFLAAARFLELLGV